MQSTPETRALAQGVLDYIHEFPEQHDQHDWFVKSDSCGTTMCIAGTTLFLKYGATSMGEAQRFTHQDGGMDFEDRAADLLGLDDRELFAMFYEMDNELAVQRLKKIVVGEPFSEEDFNNVEDD